MTTTEAETTTIEAVITTTAAAITTTEAAMTTTEAAITTTEGIIMPANFFEEKNTSPTEKIDVLESFFYSSLPKI